MASGRTPSPSHGPDVGAAKAAPWVLAGGALALAFLVLVVHATPFYGVETDLFGDLIPTARALRAWHADAGHFLFKGPGYPMLLAAIGALAGGNDWFAARLIDVLAATTGAWFAYRITRRFLSARAGLFVMLALFANAVWLGAATEAGTDMPAFALALAATDLVLGATSRRAWLAAGLVAGLAVVTRYNTIFLPVAAALVLAHRAITPPRDPAATAGAPGARAPLLAYLLGFALPVGTWAVASQFLPGGPWRDLNYLNVAYEIYGRQTTWDAYWPGAARAFHSLGDVLRLDPGRAARTLAGNVATRWWTDAHQLLPVWLGLPALAGMALVWPRRPGAIALAIHPLLAYLVLATVFYSARFFVYLIPFQLMGLAALILHAGRSSPRGPASRAAGAASSPAAPGIRVLARAAPVALAALALAVSARGTVRQMRAALAQAPIETREAGAVLRELGPAGARVMARKPQVAYFAGMEDVAMVGERSLLGLVTGARARGVQYLYFSGIEASLGPELLVLADPDFDAPGLEHVPTPAAIPGHEYALYRFAGGPFDPGLFESGARRGVLAFAHHHGSDPRVQWCAASTLLDLDQDDDALRVLEQCEAIAPNAPQSAVLLAAIRLKRGDRAGAEAACRAALAGGYAPRELLVMLGEALAARGDLADARRALARATDLDPLDPDVWLRLAIVESALGDRRAADLAFARCRTIAPDRRAVCDSARAAFAPRGDPGTALAIAGRLPRPAIDLSRLIASAPH